MNDKRMAEHVRLLVYKKYTKEQLQLLTPKEQKALVNLYHCHEFSNIPSTMVSSYNAWAYDKIAMRRGFDSSTRYQIISELLTGEELKKLERDTQIEDLRLKYGRYRDE